jgi:GcrA cell cycle regulator
MPFLALPSAVCAKVQRLGLKRGRNPPTAKPRIVSRSRRRPTKRRSVASQGAPSDRLSSLPLRPLRKVIAPRRAKGHAEPFTKRELHEILAKAVRNTG